ncbi:MAG: tRNA dihydrouridine synthase DusB [Candidatus Gastranaerophilales bacterium]|nr:tRNA dihydrouridine synthase DusB [Candidatus Gastranaerophilales bacterium]
MNTTETKQIKIGKIEIKSNVMLAPMAGITDSVVRQLIRKFSKNCLLTTEMISSEALVQRPYGAIIHCEEIEHPLAFQLSGHKPQLMAKAAKIIEDKASIIDINMGCPVNKVVKGTDGCALMKNPDLAIDILKAIKDVVSTPVTCKFRLGWSQDQLNFVDFAKRLEEAGADAITVHGRTRVQFYAGSADWKKISDLKGEINIPLYANGDITDLDSAINCLTDSQADGIALGRGAIGDPTLLYRIEHYFQTGEKLPAPNIKERIELLKEHILKEIELRNEDVAIKFVRKFYPYYIKGIRGGSEYRFNLVREDSLEKIFTILDDIVANG